MEVIKQTLSVKGINVPFALFEPTTASKEWAVLWLQGFTSTIEGHTEGVTRMAEQTKTVFGMINCAGHGDHPTPLAEATRSQQFTEVIAAYDKLTSLGYKKIIVIGGSFGGYMAALLAAQREITGLVLRAPATYDDDEFDLPFKATRSGTSNERKDIWRDQVTKDTPNDAFDAVRNYTGDTYVIEHELDSVVNKSIPQTYFAVAQHPNYLLIRGLDHSPKQMPNPQHYFDLIESWLQAIIENIQKAQQT